MILNLILVLGISIIFTETPRIDCNADFSVNGCYCPYTKQIILDLQGEDVTHTLYHEIGHAIFLKDEQAKTIVKHYPPLRNYCNYYNPLKKNYPGIYSCVKGYDTEEQLIDERVANYYTWYKINNSEFSITHPSLYIFFRDKENEILK